jgi:hypothetical protein
MLTIPAAIAVLSLALPDTGWTLVKKTSRFEVSVLPIPGKDVEAFRSRGSDSIPLPVVGETLIDLPGMIAWCPYLKESKILRTVGPDHFVAYQRYDLPWPFTDRDIVVDVDIRRHPTKALIEAKLNAIADNSCPPVPDVIRLTDMDGSITVRAVGKGAMQGSYAERIDLGGGIPISLARMFSREMPAKILENLLKECRKPERIKAGAASPLVGWLDSALARKGTP